MCTSDADVTSTLWHFQFSYDHFSGSPTSISLSLQWQLWQQWQLCFCKQRPVATFSFQTPHVVVQWRCSTHGYSTSEVARSESHEFGTVWSAGGDKVNAKRKLPTTPCHIKLLRDHCCRSGVFDLGIKAGLKFCSRWHYPY